MDDLIFDLGYNYNGCKKFFYITYIFFTSVRIIIYIESHLTNVKKSLFCIDYTLDIKKNIKVIFCIILLPA